MFFYYLAVHSLVWSMKKYGECNYPERERERERERELSLIHI